MECESPTQDHPTPKFAMPAVLKLSHTLLEEILHQHWIHAPVERLCHLWGKVTGLPHNVRVS
eukprot:2295386-Rhodomonas_salina.1